MSQLRGKKGNCLEFLEWNGEKYKYQRIIVYITGRIQDSEKRTLSLKFKFRSSKGRIH